MNSEKKEPTTVVFVTNQKRCVNLIRIGKKVAQKAKMPLMVVNISSHALSESDATAINYLFEQSRANGAQMHVIYSDTPLEEMRKAIADFAAKHIITGAPQEENSVVYKLKELYPDKIFYTVEPEQENYIENSFQYE